MKWNIQHKHALWIFILLAVISRFFTFFDTVLDHDESTYLVFAQQLSEGAILYVDLIDLKPPLGLWLFSMLYELFGICIPLYRFFLALIIGVTAFFIYRISRNLSLNDFSALLAGILFIVINLFHHALSFNLEHWMNLFTVMGFYFYLQNRTSRGLLIAALLIGVSFGIKYLSLTDFLVLSGLHLYFFMGYRQFSIAVFSRFLGQIVLAFTAFVLPFALVNLYFWFSDNWEAFKFITYIAPGNYSGSVGLWDRMDFLLDFHVRYLAYCIPFYWALFSKKVNRDAKAVSLIWLLGGLLACQLTGRFFDHYTIQCFPALCLLAGAIGEYSMIEKFKTKSLAILLMVAGATAIFNYFDYFLEEDPHAQILEYINEKSGPDVEVLPINTSTVINFVRQQKPRTPYVHSSLLFKDFHIKTLGINVQKELDKFKNPYAPYILIEDDKSSRKWIDPLISEDYILDKRFKKGLILYRLQKTKSI